LTASDFDRAFGGASAERPTFAARLGRAGLEANGTTAQVVGAADEYRPFRFLPSGENMGVSLEISRWLDGTDIVEGVSLSYRVLLRVGFTGDSEIRLYLLDMIIIIEGRELSLLREKLARQQVTHIVQYSPRIWPKAPSGMEPIVERITFAVPERG